MSQTFSIVIPTRNGLKRLRENLPSVAGVKSHPAFRELILVDDGGTDGSEEWISSTFPFARVLRNPEPRGFIFSVNRGVDRSVGDIAVLLNNDVAVRAGFPDTVLPHFEDPALFAVTFRALFPGSGAFREGAKGLVFRAGFPKVRHAERHCPGRAAWGVPSFYPVGGHCAIRGTMFRRLGGLDTLFEPFYWEDADLGFRAWKKGWRTVYEPGCEVVHNEQGTIKELHPAPFIKDTRYRNRFLFVWKNIDSPALLAGHILFSCLRLLLSWLWGDFRYYRSFRSALKRLLPAIRGRRERIRRGERAMETPLFRLFRPSGRPPPAP